MARCQYSVRAYFVVCALIASFFGGLQTRRAVLEADVARARGQADAAVREKKKLEKTLEIVLTAVQLQQRLATGQARTAELLAGPRRKEAGEPRR